MAFLKFLGKGKPRKPRGMPPMPKLAPIDETRLPLKEEPLDFPQMKKIGLEFPTIPSGLKDPFGEKKLPNFPADIKPHIPFYKGLSKQDLEEEKTRLRELHMHIPAEPLFINVTGFRTILGDLTSIKNEIKVCDKILDRLNDIKNQEDKQLEKWCSYLEDLERKLIYVDKILFEPQGGIK